MGDLRPLARRLGEAADVSSAAEALAAHALSEAGALRVWVLAPGDRCRTCLRARECTTRDRCLHLESTLGAFAQPPGHVERIPRTATPWSKVLEGQASGRSLGAPTELAAPGSERGRAYLIPLVAGGDVLGVLGVRLDGPARRGMRARLEEAALLAAAALRQIRGEEERASRARHVSLLEQLARQVGGLLDDTLLLRQVVAEVRRTFGFPNVMVFLRDHEDGTFRLRARSSETSGPSRIGDAIGPEEGIVARVARSATVEVVPDVSVDPDFVAWFPETRSEMAAPVLIDGEVVGVLNVESDRIAAFGTGEVVVLETVAHQLAIALENARLFGLVKAREERYRALVESNPGAVLHLDTEGRIVFHNPAAEEIFGLEGSPGTTDLARLVAPEDQPAVGAALAEALAGVPHPDLQAHVVRADGQRRWVQAWFQPLQDDLGRPQGAVVLARDRSREKELQDRLVQSEKLGAIGGLVSGVAHELNNPLAGILGYAQLLLSSPPETWTRSDLEKIEHNARRCQAIVESLLQFARQARLRKRPANLNEVVESVLRLNEYQLRMDDVKVQRTYDPRVPMLELDVNRWQQVIINLASNAHQAMVSASSPRRELAFETKLGDGEVLLRVSDTGPGIPPELKARIFEPFFTTKDAGTGLGLSICYGIVREHGGTIELDPSWTPGTRFVVRLPVARTLGTAPAPASPPCVAARADVGKGRRVVVLEDEPPVRDVVRDWLSRHRFQVETYGVAEDALAGLETSGADAILVDVALSGETDGLAFYDRLAARSPALTERVVFVTGYAFHEGLATAIEERGAPCLTKPFDLHELLRVVVDLASRRPSRPSPDGPSAASMPDRR